MQSGGEHRRGFRIRTERGEHPRVPRGPAVSPGGAGGGQRLRDGSAGPWHPAGGSGQGFLCTLWVFFVGRALGMAMAILPVLLPDPSPSQLGTWKIFSEAPGARTVSEAWNSLEMHRKKSIHALAPSGALFELSRTAPAQLTRLAVPTGVTAVTRAASTLEVAAERSQVAVSQLSRARTGSSFPAESSSSDAPC